MTLRRSMKRDISRRKYECVVCLERIGPKSKIWSCEFCFRAIDLKCVKEWCEKSSVSGDQFNCPNCRVMQDKPSMAYRCWCKKELLEHTSKANGNRSCIHGATAPHSCGQTCGARRSCPHPCPLTCHPGPHLDSSNCVHQGPRIECFCGKHTEQTVCHDTRYEGFSCGELCSRVNEVCGHECSKRCHPTDNATDEQCGPCATEVLVECHCTKLQNKSMTCGELPLESRRLASAKQTVSISCGATCNLMLDCNRHKCNRTCHPDKNHQCPLQPIENEKCFCGKTLTGRQTCSETRRSCANICEKKLVCGHICKRQCHDGECEPCQEIVSDASCRCGRTKQEAPCWASFSDPPLCANKCGEHLSCERHRCKLQCCPFDFKKRQALARRKKEIIDERRSAPLSRRLRKRSHLHIPTASNSEILGSSEGEDELSVLAAMEAEFRAHHTCLKICDRLLSCQAHRCEMVCHSGPCAPCTLTSFEEWECPCGKTIVLPPIKCGTLMPVCGFECHRPQACGHSATHLCHPDDVSCSPCTVVISRPCLCGKSSIRARCSHEGQEIPRCMKACENIRSCGHTCGKLCCPGECDLAPCANVCGKMYPVCGHSHDSICHFPERCPVECSKTLRAKCPCGALQCSYECGEALEISCNEACVSEALHPDLRDALKVELSWLSRIEAKVIAFITDSGKQTIWFQPMSSYHRKLVHLVLSRHGIRGESMDSGPSRSVCGYRTAETCLRRFQLRWAPRKPPLIETLSLQDNISETTDEDHGAVESGESREPDLEDGWTRQKAAQLPTHGTANEETTTFKEASSRQVMRELQRSGNPFQLLI